MLLTIDLPSSIARLCLSPQGTRLALANEDAPGEVLVIECDIAILVGFRLRLQVREIEQPRVKQV